MLILSYENEISLTCKLNSFSYERISTRTRFEEEAKGNSEMAYSFAKETDQNVNSSGPNDLFIMIPEDVKLWFNIGIHGKINSLSVA